MRKGSKFNKSALIVFMAIFVVLGSYFAYSSFAAPPAGKGGGHGGKTTTIQTPNLSLSPSSQRVAYGSNLSIEVWADSADQPVNAVQVDLIYPTDKLNFVNVDATTSNFNVAAQASGGNGTVTIARGNLTPLSGKQLVAKVNFTANASKGKASIAFGSKSTLLSAVSNTSILAATYGGKYSLAP